MRICRSKRCQGTSRRSWSGFSSPANRWYRSTLYPRVSKRHSSTVASARAPDQNATSSATAFRGTASARRRAARPRALESNQRPTVSSPSRDGSARQARIDEIPQSRHRSRKAAGVARAQARPSERGPQAGGGGSREPLRPRGRRAGRLHAERAFRSALSRAPPTRWARSRRRRAGAAPGGARRPLPPARVCRSRLADRLRDSQDRFATRPRWPRRLLRGIDCGWC